MNTTSQPSTMYPKPQNENNSTNTGQAEPATAAHKPVPKTKSRIPFFNTHKTQDTYKPSLIHRLRSFFRTLGILIVLAILGISSLFAYIVIFPDKPVSNFIISNTPLNKLISFNKESTNEQEDGTFIQSVKPGNVFFGLEEDNLSSQQSTVRLVSQTLPSVLSLRVSMAEATQPDTIRSTVDGTGFIISSGGLVVTNRHVVAQACGTDKPLSITAQDAFENAYELELLSIDPVDDIAILQIKNPGTTITPVVIGDSNKLLLGEDVIAIGNVLGQLNNSVTRGIVSGLDRTLQTGIIDECTQNSIVADGLIQTDAAINKGNSGGPLFDASGQLIGMNTFGTTEAQSVGFAIPASSIVYAIRSFNENGTIVRPRLGVYSQAITPVDAEELNWLPVNYGEILIPYGETRAVIPGSAAEVAQLKERDIILAVNDQKVVYSHANQRPLRNLLAQYKPNETITLTIRKSTGTINNIPQYESQDAKISVTLGGISFTDFKKNT